MLSERQKVLPTTRLPRSNTADPGPDTSIQFLKGVGPARATLFAKKSILSIRDLLFHFPRRYEDRRRIFAPGELEQVAPGSLVCVRARIIDVREHYRRGQRAKMVQVKTRGNDEKEMLCLWFRTYQGLVPRLREMGEAVFTGTLDFRGGTPLLVHPETESTRNEFSAHWGRIVPIYSTTQGLTQRAFREAVAQALTFTLPQLEESLPEEVRERFHFQDLATSLQAIHFPETLPAAGSEGASMLRRFAFEEFLEYCVSQILSKSLNTKVAARPITIVNQLARQIRACLPFQLTEGQESALAEIRQDLQAKIAMNRILQGDVGSGKTIVALLAAADLADQGLQTAIVVPTETLAEQHYAKMREYLAATPHANSIELLTGSCKKRAREEIHKRIHDRKALIVVGTHALLESTVPWSLLGLVIFDEQHRFGVRQRTKLLSTSARGPSPHMLTMTATPIPRSLALTIFGDLQVSAIRLRPQGRLPIKTKVLRSADRQKAYNLVHREVRAGRQAFIIFPLIEDSEEEGMASVRSAEAEFKRLSEGPLKGLALSLVHGRLSNEERQSRMRDFSQGKSQVLLATTVIEVGIDVPNATTMIVENAERFGLAQLHQIRGRVGRGEHQSYCCLLTEAEPKGEKTIYFSEAEEPHGATWDRLMVLENSVDGFAIAEADLELRGAGDLIGHRQSGVPTFSVGNLVRDRELFAQARQVAEEICRRDPHLQEPEHKGLRQHWQKVRADLEKTLRSG